MVCEVDWLVNNSQASKRNKGQLSEKDGTMPRNSWMQLTSTNQ